LASSASSAAEDRCSCVCLLTCPAFFFFFFRFFFPAGIEFGESLAAGEGGEGTGDKGAAVSEAVVAAGSLVDAALVVAACGGLEGTAADSAVAVEAAVMEARKRPGMGVGTRCGEEG
jgi:hypothetical protein